MDTRLFDENGILRGQEVGEVSEWLAPRLIAELWVEGSDDDRAEIDRCLNRVRERQWADQATLFTFK